MPLKTKLSFISIDKTGNLIIMRDTTGSYHVTDNPTGYGGANPVNIKEVIFKVNKFNSSLGRVIKQSQTLNNPELPPITNIINGQDILLTSDTLGITPQDGGTSMFNDGVLEVTMQSIIDSSKTVNAIAGQPYIVGTGFNVYDNYDEIALNGKIYKINKTLSTNGGTLLHLNRYIETDATVAYPVRIANTKVLVQTQTDRLFVNMIANTASNLNVEKKFGEVERFPKLRPLLNIMTWKFAAQVAFENKDYKEANKLLDGITLYAKGGHCGC